MKLSLEARDGLDEKEHALTWLERVVTERSGSTAYLAVEPRLDNLLTEISFFNLMEHVGISRI